MQVSWSSVFCHCIRHGLNSTVQSFPSPCVRTLQTTRYGGTNTYPSPVPTLKMIASIFVHYTCKSCHNKCIKCNIHVSWKWSDNQRESGDMYNVMYMYIPVQKLGTPQPPFQETFASERKECKNVCWPCT